MKQTYLSLKAKHKAEIDAFPIVFAFNTKQFEEAMTKLGLTPADTDKIYKIPGGGFIRKTDSDAFSALLDKIETEEKAAFAADTDGTGYIFQMFDYELNNHEYSYTHDYTSTLHALGLTLEEVEANPIMSEAFKRALAAQ